MTKDDGSAARLRILRAAAELIRSKGADAATTRAVAKKARVQVPTIYRLVGDKSALLDAVAEHELAAYVSAKAKRTPNPDPVEELRAGWDMHVAFGLANPELFRIMSRNTHSPAAESGWKVLRGRIHAIALRGRLRAGEERAADMVHAACMGTVLELLACGESRPDLSADTREAIIAAITNRRATGAHASLASAATTLRALLGHSPVLTKGEAMLVDELLERIADSAL